MASWRQTPADGCQIECTPLHHVEPELLGASICAQVELVVMAQPTGSRPAEWCHLDRSILNAMTIMP